MILPKPTPRTGAPGQYDFSQPLRMRRHQVQEFISRYLCFVRTAKYQAWTDVLQHALMLLSHISRSLEHESSESRADQELGLPLRIEILPSSMHIPTELLRRIAGDQDQPRPTPMEGVTSTIQETADISPHRGELAVDDASDGYVAQPHPVRVDSGVEERMAQRPSYPRLVRKSLRRKREI